MLHPDAEVVHIFNENGGGCLSPEEFKEILADATKLALDRPTKKDDEGGRFQLVGFTTSVWSKVRMQSGTLRVRKILTSGRRGARISSSRITSNGARSMECRASNG